MDEVMRKNDRDDNVVKANAWAFSTVAGSPDIIADLRTYNIRVS